MAIVQAHKVTQISQALDPKKGIIEAIGDITGIELLYNTVLIGTYIRPERTKGGIIRPDSNKDEDQYQSKTGLVLLKGRTAFVDDDYNKFNGIDVNIGDWVLFWVGDGKQCIINGVHCRLLQDTEIRARVDTPERVF